MVSAPLQQQHPQSCASSRGAGRLRNLEPDVLRRTSQSRILRHKKEEPSHEWSSKA